MHKNLDLKKGSRFDHAVPNCMVVSANQWADNACNILMGKTSGSFKPISTFIKPTDIYIGLTGALFAPTHEGRLIDQEMPEYIEGICTREMLNQIKQYPMEGLFGQLSASTTLHLDMIGRSSYY